MKHTLGPWKYSSDLSAIVFIDVQQHKIKVIADFGKIEHHTENARLIAAAPDLLEACKNLMASYEDLHPTLFEDENLEFSPEIMMARQAIAKATKGDT